MPFLGDAKLRLEDLQNRPGIAMDGFEGELFLNLTAAQVAGTATLGTDFVLGSTVYLVPIYAMTVGGTAAAPTLTLAAGDLGGTNIAAADGALLLGKRQQEFI